MQTIARLSLLSGRQIYLAGKMAQPIVHEGPESSPSDDCVSCSSFDEAETEQKKEHFIDRMARKLVNSK